MDRTFSLAKEISNPSIFNDVLGPVMRGPSSSHTAAAHRIGLIAKTLFAFPIKEVFVEFDKYGSLATTYLGQGSAMGLAGGLLDIDMVSEDMVRNNELLAQAGLVINYKITDSKAEHPNTYKIRLKGHFNDELKLVAISTGGGMIEVVEVDGWNTSIKGDYFESLACFDELNAETEIRLVKDLKNKWNNIKVVVSKNENKTLVHLKSRHDFTKEIHTFLNSIDGLIWLRESNPVLPVLSGNPETLKFSSYKELLAFAKDKSISLSDLAMEYETSRSGLSKKDIVEKMSRLVELTRESIKIGLKGTNYKHRILGPQSHLIADAEKKSKIYPSSTNTIIGYTSAIMEVKSAMGVIIAMPTAGACGVLGGAFFGAFGKLDVDHDLLVRGFLAAGLTGIFIARDYTFAAEEGGCQVECGAASGMAAAGLVEMMGGSYLEALNAASMAMQNMIGLICDPVACRVEVPCLGKNILAATNALNNANMSLAGFDVVIPLDEVIQAMKAVGDLMPSSVCCTGLSGLANTPAARSILEKLK